VLGIYLLPTTLTKPFPFFLAITSSHFNESILSSSGHFPYWQKPTHRSWSDVMSLLLPGICCEEGVKLDLNSEIQMFIIKYKNQKKINLF
jgi:hypothetical protein